MEEVAAVRGVDIEEDAGDDNCPLLEKLFEERQTVVQGRGELLEIEPDVESRDGRADDGEAEVRKSLEHVVARRLEVLLERDLLLVHALGVQERDCGELEAEEGCLCKCANTAEGSRCDDVRVIGTSIKEGARLRQRSNQVLGAEDPTDTPARKTPVLMLHRQAAVTRK